MKSGTQSFKHIGLAALTLLASIPSLGSAAELAGITMPEQLQKEGTSLVLNGQGLRKFLFFKVYVAGLYLTEKSNSSESILASDSPKFMQLNFLRDVSAADIKKAWKEGFEKNCSGTGCAEFVPAVAELNALMGDCKETDVLEFGFTASGVSVWQNNTKKGEVKHPLLARNILAIFIGKNPPNAELKAGLLAARSDAQNAPRKN